MAFSCHIQLSRVPPRCVMLWRSPEMNFTRRPRVAKLLCIGSPLNRSRDITYCTMHNSFNDQKALKHKSLVTEMNSKVFFHYHCTHHHHHLDDHGDSSVACVVRVFVPRVRDRFAVRPTSCSSTPSNSSPSSPSSSSPPSTPLRSKQV